MTQTSSVAGALPRMSSELRASRSTALLSGIASSSSLPLGMLRDALRHATEARETEESGLKLRPCATASDSGGDSGPGKVYRSSRGKLRGLEEAER